MSNYYKEQIEKIKTPDDLKEKTKLLMLEELNKNKPESHVKKFPLPIKKYQKTILLAALIGIVSVPSIYYYQNHYTVETISQNHLIVSPKFGKNTNEKQSERIKVYEVDSEDMLPTYFEDIKTSRIKGISVKIAKDNEGVYYASFQKEKSYFYLIGNDVKEKEFINFIKNKI